MYIKYYGPQCAGSHKFEKGNHYQDTLMLRGDVIPSYQMDVWEIPSFQPSQTEMVS